MSASNSNGAQDSDRPKARSHKFVELADLIKVYGNLPWHRANTEALDVISREHPVTLEGEPIDVKPIEGLEKAYDFLIQRYLEYVVLFKILQDSMKRLLHPQKRILFKRFIEAVAARICELRNEMTKLTSVNIHNLTAYLSDFGLTPWDVVYGIPDSMLQDQKETTELRERVLACMLGTLQSSEDCEISELIECTALREDKTSRKTTQDGQTATRFSNVSSLRTSVISDSTKVRKETRESSRGSAASTASSKKPASVPSLPASEEVDRKRSSTIAALNDFLSSRRFKEALASPRFHVQVKLLQRRWRRWMALRSTALVKHDVNLFVHMEHRTDYVHEPDDELYDEMRQERDEEQTSYVEVLRKNYLSGSEANFDRWQLKLNLEQWVLELRDLLGKCPPYPEPEQGGCSLLFSDKTVEQVTEELEELEENDKKKAPAKGEEKKKKKEEGKGKGKKDKDEGFLWTMPKSVAIPELVSALVEYGSYWSYKEEDENLEQRVEFQLIKEKLREEAESTIRSLVDTLIIQELERLRAVDREGKPKADKKKEKKDKSKSKGKRGKKDPTEGKTLDQLYAELVIGNIMKKPMQVTLDDYVGAANLTDKTRETCRLPTPPDIKMALREMFGLPLCSKIIHSNTDLRNSVLLAGPPGVGKTLMVHSLARETGANLVDLSPVNLVGKYQGKKLEDYLMNVLLKVGKDMEPTIFFVDECHLLFPTKKARKRPDVDRDRPTRWAKMLTRLMKKLKQGDRMLLIGMTSEPFFAKTGAMCKLFQNTFLIPFPEYGSRVLLWQHFLGRLNLARPHSINVSVMAKITEGLTGGDIKKIVERAIPPARQSSKICVRNAEIIPVLAEHLSRVEAPDLEAWVTWYLTTPLMKAREAVLQGIVEEEEAAAAAAAKKK